MYKLIAFISVIIRNFYLPNPFASFDYGSLINWMIEPLLHIITFGVVGLFYQRGSEPVLGSFLYLFFYATHTGLIMLCSIFSFNKMTIVSVIVFYIVILITLMRLKDKFHIRYL